MTALDTTTATKTLVQRRLNGTRGERLPLEARPETLDQAIAIQDAITQHWCENQDDSVGAWKCLLPSPNKLVIGPIYTRTIDSIPPVALWPQAGVARIEPELAFFLAKDLPPRPEPYTPEEVDAALGRTHMALELIFNRYEDNSCASFPEILADGLVNQGLFIGPEINAATAASTQSMTIRLHHSGHSQEFLGKHPNQNPKAPLYWLANFLRENGKGLIAGQAVITGSFAGVFDVPLNTPITLEYENLGRMQVEFTARKAP